MIVGAGQDGQRDQALRWPLVWWPRRHFERQMMRLLYSWEWEPIRRFAGELRGERLLWEASCSWLRGQDAVGVPLFKW